MCEKFTAMASIAQLLALVVLSSFLAACSQDNRTADIKQCIAKGEVSQKQWDPFQTADTAEERHDHIGGIVAACMNDAGYGHANRDQADARCIDDVDFNPYCYRRRS
jgi:hypothetical protein